MGWLRDTNTQSHKLKIKEENGESHIDDVELMDNVSPLWCWQAGRMSLLCIFKTPKSTNEEMGVGVC